MPSLPTARRKQGEMVMPAIVRNGIKLAFEDRGAGKPPPSSSSSVWMTRAPGSGNSPPAIPKASRMASFGRTFVIASMSCEWVNPHPWLW